MGTMEDKTNLAENKVLILFCSLFLYKYQFHFSNLTKKRYPEIIIKHGTTICPNTLEKKTRNMSSIVVVNDAL